MYFLKFVTRPTTKLYIMLNNSNKANHDIINLLESARYSTEPSAIDWDISKSLPNHLLMGQGKTCF